MKRWSITEVIAVCAIASPVLVTFINVIFKSHSEKINHRLASLNASIKSKQNALNQISKAYSIFVIEGHNNDKKALEIFLLKLKQVWRLLTLKIVKYSMTLSYLYAKIATLDMRKISTMPGMQSSNRLHLTR